MKKKLILISATFAIGILSYRLFSLTDHRVQRPALTKSPQQTRQFITPLTTQRVETLANSDFNLSPGDQPRVRVYDDVSGRLKYQFEARRWEPINNTDYKLSNVEVQIYAPRGEITYISADDAQVTLNVKGKNRIEPKSGWLQKNVKVVIDRSTSAWREANPAKAARSAHPDDLVNITLQEARFDLELAELHSDGPVHLDSVDAKIDKVSGLTVQWNQVDGRIDVLKFNHGGIMALSRGGRAIDFALPGGERSDKPARKEKGQATAAMAQQRAAAEYQAAAPRAQANMPVSVDAVSGTAAAAQVRMEGGAPLPMMAVSVASPPAAGSPTSQRADLRDPQALASAMETMQKEARSAQSGELAELIAREDAEKKKARVHTYRAVFNNHIVVEQQDATRTIGKLEADRLELNFDFGKKQKEFGPDAGAAAPTSQATSRPSKPAVPFDAAPTDNTRLVLTWDGPLDLHPLRVNPEEQTGQRFDAVATGEKVTISGEQGGGECKQLVYRHERRQVWLSGGPSLPVDLKLADGKRLVARELFFDQKRGLAHIEGAGTMTDDRKTVSTTGASDELALSKTRRAGKGAPPDAKHPPKPKKPQEPVQIAWSRGVDIEIGSQPVDRINPTTGLREQKQKEFLRRAWFHGNVDMHQGTEQLTADEVAATFAASAAIDQATDQQLQHLNMTGRVRLQREGDVITADHLDIEMAAADGRSYPRVVDALGDAMAQQGQRVIRADHMHVTLGMSAVTGKTSVQGDKIVQETKTKLGIESIDARGHVFAHDPDNQLKIRDADQLVAAIEQGSKLVHATIDSLDGRPPAKVRAGETAIHGQHIDIDVPSESVDVPGPGKAWMMTEQDFGGRKLTKPTPVRIVWSGQMQMRGSKNYGVFVGDVHSKSDAFSLACDKLTVRLAESQAPAPKMNRASLMDQFWLTRAYRSAGSRGATNTTFTNVRPRKRPTHVTADGNAEVLSSTYAIASEPSKGRLLSRMQILGPQVVADLTNQRMSVPGKGSLLLEDYQFNSQGKRSRSASTPRSGPLMSSAQSEGPSQTVVFWDASMDYYLDQNLVAFDQNVDMRHLSGRQMVMKEELVAGMGMDPAIGNELREGRKAQLTAGYLLLQFKTSPRKEAGDAVGPPVRATDLEKLVAKQKVFLQVDTRTLLGEYVQYSADIDEVQVEGSKTVEARIFDEGEGIQRYSEWRGPLLIWNRRTNAIEAPQSNIRTSRR